MLINGTNENGRAHIINNHLADVRRTYMMCMYWQSAGAKWERRRAKFHDAYMPFLEETDSN